MMSYYQEGVSPNAQPTFCLEPGKKLPDGSKATYRIYTATGDETIPGVGDSDKFVPITLAYEWIQRIANLRDPVCYAVVQTYIWGCVGGYAEDWEVQEEAQKKLAAILNNNHVLNEFASLKEFVQDGLEEFSNSSWGGLPEWNGTQQEMSLEDGVYTLTLNITSCPQLKNVIWGFPDVDWSYQVIGDSIVFQYNGSKRPEGEVRSSDLYGVGNKYYAYIFTPGDNGQLQHQVGRFENEEVPAQVSFIVGSPIKFPGSVTFTPYRHTELFDSHYNISLEKYCAETNQPLEGSVFDIWEDFDRSQLSGHRYREGSPDGRTGCLYDNAFEPFPLATHICDTVTTGQDGRGEHRDIRSYRYSKTYCTGHPAPEWVDVPEEEYDEVTGECTNEGEIEAAEAENERLHDLWMAQQELCSETCDFHVGNEDEDNHDYDYSAQEEMLEDRDETYEKFINLEYLYTLKEKTARTGYILHGRHKDDQVVETVSVSSAESGGGARRAEMSGALQSSVEPEESHNQPAISEELKRLVFSVAAPGLSLEDLRRVEDVAPQIVTASGSSAARNNSVAADHSKPSASSASESEADYFILTDEGDGDDDEFEEEMIPGSYRYIWKTVEIPHMRAASASEAVRDEPETPVESLIPESWGPAFFRLAIGRLAGERGMDLSDEFPDFTDDDLGGMETGGYGEPSTLLYAFKAWDHRTEGELHINKRDLELYRADPEHSFGRTQGDATLEGAVYGLFAAQDLVHPDGKSGIIYNQNDLVAVASTDQDGDASFLAFTENPGTRLDSDGNLLVPEGPTGAVNLYNGSTITSSSCGFGAISYPDYAAENGGQWIGRPLLMGRYYVRELSRSEGYELSVQGILASETNREADGTAVVAEAGTARISAGLSDYNDMNADGSWNDFIVESYRTENGYDVVVAGYPEGTRFYRMEVEQVTETVQTITGSTLEPKKDGNGNVVYQTAKGGEYKTDGDGNPIVKDLSDHTKPQAETVPYRFRMSGYPRGEAEPEDITRWQEPVGDFDYLRDEVNKMLQKAGYRALSDEDGSPWFNLKLAGDTNAEAGTEILDWFTEHNTWDSASVRSVYEDEEGDLYARFYYDYSKVDESYPAFYDAMNQKLCIRKEMTVEGREGSGHYWVQYEKGEYTLGGTTATAGQRREIPEGAAVPFGDEIEVWIEAVYQPSYETYAPGETLMGPDGQPVPVMERTYTYGEAKQTVDRESSWEVAASREDSTGYYTIHVENETDWEGVSGPEYTRFRAVTRQTDIEYQGEPMPYNRYLVEAAGAGVSANASVPAFDAGSYIVAGTLVYPGQIVVYQDGGTRDKPLQVLERVIKQPIRITKDISQASYDNVNTYGSLHNDPLTVFLGLFGVTGGRGIKQLSQFKFKLYLKRNLEAIYVDENGGVVSEELYDPEFKGLVQTAFAPPKGGAGRQLLEIKADGTYDYRKFFDALKAAGQADGAPRDFAVRQFAVTYLDVAGYKQEILSAEPELGSDIADERALERAVDEAAVYLSAFRGLEEKLAIAWDSDPDGGPDHDRTTLQCNTKNGKDDYYNSSVMLPYGTYVVVEQVPAAVKPELANRHYERDYPKEIVLPFAPDIGEDGNTGETVVDSGTGNPFFNYNSQDRPEDLIRKYKIRFNEESHVIRAHRSDGDFLIYKYGLKIDGAPEKLRGKHISCSEVSGTVDGVVYSGRETQSGELEIRDNVASMTGVNTAVDGKYAAMLVPWTILEPAVDRVNPDTGNVETLTPSGSGADFNYVAYATEDFENKYASSKLRIEKLDAQTGENIIHSGALFRIYAAKREVEQTGGSAVSGSGKVLFGEAVDLHGNRVVDAADKPVLYPRVGQLNGGDSDLPIRLDREGIPLYDETQLIRQRDEDGNETGIFKAYSTVREVVVDGAIRKETVGYIETCRPLGAGAYVLVEIQAPEGYTKSRPVAFEVYGDSVHYYAEKWHSDGTTDGWERIPAVQYQYAVPVQEAANKFGTETVSRIEVEDYPSRVEIYKVEDGDSLVGNENGLKAQDAWGNPEASGGFIQEIAVNDAGDHLVYEVRGRKEYLEERGDVQDITYDPETKEWSGRVIKANDEYSEQIIEGTEMELKAMDHVKPLYHPDGTFSGKGIRFGVAVSGAGLALYRGIELEKTGENQYKGVTAVWADGKVERVTDRNTGTHKEIRITGSDSGLGGLDIWDAVELENDPVDLYFYDLQSVETRYHSSNNELAVLDSRGNEICFADSVTGMAYVYDDYGRMIAYTADDQGQKELVRSIQIKRDGTVETLYPDKVTEDDENGLPVYYRSGSVITKEECWTTDQSAGADGTPETEGAVHQIARLPFGAYILQEEQVPYGQGYVQSRYLGIVLRDTGEVQKYFLSNEFTRTAFSKVDVRTQREIQGAEMTLYRAEVDTEGKPVTDENGNYVKGEAVAAWISGYECDDRGNLKLGADGERIPTTKPHWIDHIPVGPYVLEETICPYEQGYVQSKAMPIDVRETGNVQSYRMEDDFTSVDIRKYDTENGEILYEDSAAWLSLYPALLDEEGNPVRDEAGEPVYDPENEIFTFRAATYRDGQEVAATGRLTEDAAGNHPIMKYDYCYRPIPNTLQGRYYYTETGTTRIEYLPVGSYVLVESGNPAGYATAPAMLLTVEDTGHLEEIQAFEMGDRPLTLQVSKVSITGGKEVKGAGMAIYEMDGQGNVSVQPLMVRRPGEGGAYEEVEASWVSGMDGIYTREEAEAGEIPEGFEAGDLKPHIIRYIPEGDYVLEEVTTPYGFLQSVRVPFTIRDTGELQSVEMIDRIPDGELELVKYDTDEPEMKLAGAEFQLLNRTLGTVCGTVVTDEQGVAKFPAQPIGYQNSQGEFTPYTYVCTETKAPAGHMLTLPDYEFQFQYEDSNTPLLTVEYRPANDSNRVRVDKVIRDTGELLEGAALQIERTDHPEAPESGKWEVVDRWISTRQPHYSKGLEAGTYRLVETQTPGDGYPVLAEPILFVIEDGMREVLHLTMPNDTTAVDIGKTVGASQTLLAGARLALICKSDGRTVEEWTSTDQGAHRIYGLPAGTYIIRELEAPSGYRRGEDREIVVDQGGKIQVFQYENYRKSSGGGGGTPDIPPETFISFRKADSNGTALPGAQFTFYNQDGSVLGISVSDSSGMFRIKKPADGTYTFRETGAPAGYALNSQVFSFTVLNGVVETGVYQVEDARLEVPLHKLDGETGRGISGAVLRITEPDTGKILMEAGTDDEGLAVFRPSGPGRYRLEEVQAPEGYVRTEAQMEFSVLPDGTVEGNTCVYNFREEMKIGRITAYYKTSLRGDGVLRFRGQTPELVKTGDDTPLEWIAAGILICLAGMIISGGEELRRRKRERDRKRCGPNELEGHNKLSAHMPVKRVCSGRRLYTIFFLVLLAVFLFLIPVFMPPAVAGQRLWTEIRAESLEGVGTEMDGGSEALEDENIFRNFPLTKMVDGREYIRSRVERKWITGLLATVPGRIRTVLSDPFQDLPQNHIPAAVIEYEGRRYGLKSYETIPAKIGGRTLEVKKQITYQGLGAEENPPQTARLEVKDPVTGTESSVVMPLLSSCFSNERWENGLDLRIVAEDCDAGIFLLGNALVQLPGDNPDAPSADVINTDLCAALLEDLGLPADCCQITEIHWDGPSYEENDTVNRRLRVKGQRLVRDCEAVYGGMAALNPLDGQQIQAVYEELEPQESMETGRKAEGAVAAAASAGNRRILEYTAVYERSERKGGDDVNYKEVRRSAARFIPGALVVLFSVGLILCCAAAIRADHRYSEDQESYEAVRKLANAVSDGEQVEAVGTMEAAFLGVGKWKTKKSFGAPEKSGAVSGVYGKTLSMPGKFPGLPSKFPGLPSKSAVVPSKIRSAARHAAGTAVWGNRGLGGLAEHHATGGSVPAVPCTASPSIPAARRATASSVPAERHAAHLPTLPADPSNDVIALPDIQEEALRKMNPEYCFWIYIPGTRINYPVARHCDNQFYLSHRFDGGEGGCGSLFADCREKPLSGAETLVYGHNMKDGTMFAGLKNYLDEDFRVRHLNIYVYDGGAWNSYAVESCSVTGMEEHALRERGQEMGRTLDSAGTAPTPDSAGAVPKPNTTGAALTQDSTGAVSASNATGAVSAPNTTGTAPAPNTTGTAPTPTSTGAAPALPKYLTLLTCHSGGRRLVVRAAANGKGARL